MAKRLKVNPRGTFIGKKKHLQYSIYESETYCGRRDRKLITTKDASDVTCINCKKKIKIALKRR